MQEGGIELLTCRSFFDYISILQLVLYTTELLLLDTWIEDCTIYGMCDWSCHKPYMYSLLVQNAVLRIFSILPFLA